MEDRQMNELEMQIKLARDREIEHLQKMIKITKTGVWISLTFLIIWLLLPVVGLVKLV
jgi:hypothetical protein